MPEGKPNNFRCTLIDGNGFRSLLLHAMTLIEETRARLANRKSQGLTLAMIAEETGHSVPWLSMFMNGKSGDPLYSKVEFLNGWLKRNRVKPKAAE